MKTQEEGLLKFVKCLTRPLMFKQAILKPRLASKKLKAYWKDANYLNELREHGLPYGAEGRTGERAGVHTVT